MKTGTKAALIVGGVAVVGVTAAFFGSKANAANKLVLDFNSFDVALRGQGQGIIGNLPTKVQFTLTFNAINSTNDSLKFSAPFTQVFATNKRGEQVSLGHSIPSSEEITIPAKGTRPITVVVETPLFTMLTVFPDYVQYAWGRTHGEPSTRNLTVKYDYTAYGINMSDQTQVAL